jgi:hypothetical protein
VVKSAERLRTVGASEQTTEAQQHVYHHALSEHEKVPLSDNDYDQRQQSTAVFDLANTGFVSKNIRRYLFKNVIGSEAPKNTA